MKHDMKMEKPVSQDDKQANTRKWNQHSNSDSLGLSGIWFPWVSWIIVIHNQIGHSGPPMWNFILMCLYIITNRTLYVEC